MKAFRGLIFILLILVTLTACTEDNHDRPVMNIDYETNADGETVVVKNGAEQYFFQVGENEEYEVKMTFENVSGTVSAYIAKDGVKENAVYTGNDIPSGSFTVYVDEAGEYRIYYEVSDYTGTYSYTATKK